MKSILRRRPSPALVISCIALFVSLGGVSYGVATGFIDSREIKNNEIRSADIRNNQIRTFDIRNNEVRGFDIRNSSVQGRDVALNTLTGADIAEGELGKVPSATSADTAGSATSVAGVTPQVFSYNAQSGTGFSTVFSLGGLTLEAACDADRRDGGAGQSDRSAMASSRPPGGAAAPSADTTDLDPGGDFPIYNNFGNVSGTISYAGSDGRMVIVQAVAREQLADVRGTANNCGLFGVAQVATQAAALRSGCDLDDNGP